MRNRDVNLNVRMRAEELAQLRAPGEDRDLSAATFVRHMLREAYAARFGTAPPKATKSKGASR